MTVERALWFNPAHLSEVDDAKRGIRRALAEEAEKRHLVLGPVAWLTLEPGDARLTHEPPPHMAQGVKCLVGSARILAVLEAPKSRRFTSDLDPKDLERFRVITRREHALAFPQDPPLSDIECDDWIERYGPKAAAAVVRRAYDAGTLH